MDLTKYHFTFNAAAYFDTMEKYPDGFFEVFSRNDRQGLEALCWMLQEMSEQGELLRRHMGYDKEETLKAEDALLEMRPRDIAEARALVMTAWGMGLNSGKEDEETDLVLLELQKKTKTPQ